MKIKSPLSDLRDVLNQVLSSADNYGSTLKSNEAATRAVLIDPVLRTLGWDTANSFMVEVEKTLNQTRADYALYDDAGTVKTIVEAKKLGENLSQHDVKLVQYAFTFHLASIFLTDGLTWLHYTDFKPAQFAPTKVLDLQHGDLGEIAAYLVQHLDAALFWPDDKNSDVLAQQVGQLQSELSTLKQQLAALVVSAPGTVIPPKATNTASPSVSVTPPTKMPNVTAVKGVFVSLNSVGNVTRTKPSAFRLPDGSEIDVHSWTGVLVEACKFVLKHHPNLKIPMKDKSGQKVNLFDAVEPPSNIAHIEETYAGQPVYIYTNYSAINKAVNAQYVLNLLPKQTFITKPAVIFDKINL